MNLYEETSQELRRQAEGPKRALKKAAVGASIIGGSSFAPILSRAAPFLSEYIPQDLAIKGLSKINPSFGKFVKDALNDGYDFEEVKNFVGEKIKSSEKSKSEKNIIQNYSEDLFEYLKNGIMSGEDPVRMAAAAIFDKAKGFEPIIRKIEKENKSNWTDIVKGIFGTGNKSLPKKSFVESERERFQNQYGDKSQQGQNQQQTGPGQQALMDVIAKINQKLGQ